MQCVTSKTVEKTERGTKTVGSAQAGSIDNTQARSQGSSEGK